MEELAQKYANVLNFLELLDAPEEEALKALLSAFSPCQPGALRGSWRQRKNYCEPPTTQQIWKLFEGSNFKCRLCGSRLRITLDHINDNPLDGDLNNYQVLCYDCNRSKNIASVPNKHVSVRAYLAAMKLYNETGTWPRLKEIAFEARLGGPHGIGTACYMIQFIKTLVESR